MSRNKQICRIAVTIAGTIMGAGFASGQELFQFFGSYGWHGFGGIILVFLLLGWLSSRVMKEGYRLHAQGYHEVIYAVCGKRLGQWLDICTFMLLVSIYAIMLAGMDTMILQLDLFPYWGALIFPILLTSIFLRNGFEGIAKTNLIITPLLLIFTVITCTYSLVYHFDTWTKINLYSFTVPTIPTSQPAVNWVIASLQYTSYNLLLSLTVLGSLGASTPQNTIRKTGSILGVCLLGCLAILVTMAILLHYPESTTKEFPLLYVASLQHSYSHILFCIMLFLAMLTTALASQYGCAKKIESLLNLPRPFAILGIGLLGFLLSLYGFVNLISVIYPLLGTAGFLFIICLIVKALQDIRRR